MRSLTRFGLMALAFCATAQFAYAEPGDKPEKKEKKEQKEGHSKKEHKHKHKKESHSQRSQSHRSQGRGGNAGMAIFDRLDADGDGVITRREFARAQRQIEQRMQARSGRGSGPRSFAGSRGHGNWQRFEPRRPAPSFARRSGWERSARPSWGRSDFARRDSRDFRFSRFESQRPSFAGGRGFDGRRDRFAAMDRSRFGHPSFGGERFGSQRFGGERFASRGGRPEFGSERGRGDFARRGDGPERRDAGPGRREGGPERHGPGAARGEGRGPDAEHREGGPEKRAGGPERSGPGPMGRGPGPMGRGPRPEEGRRMGPPGERREHEANRPEGSGEGRRGPGARGGEREEEEREVRGPGPRDREMGRPGFRGGPPSREQGPRRDGDRPDHRPEGGPPRGDAAPGYES